MRHPRRHPGTERNKFGTLLSAFRVRKGLTQEALAFKIGKSRSSIDGWERGNYVPQTAETVLAIAKALSLSEQETDTLLLAAQYAPKYGRGGLGTDDSSADTYVSYQSERDELKAFLKRAVTAYWTSTHQALFRSPSSLTHPYKLLSPFGLDDALIFCGREAVTKDLYAKVCDHRLTVLHASSGAGKTSLLQAGLSPRFLRERRLPLYVLRYEDPVRAIKQLITSQVHGEPWPKLLHELPFPEFMEEVCDALKGQAQGIILILDQFEQFFLLWPYFEARSSFIRVLGDCYADQRLPLRFILALRNHFLSNLDEFNELLPHFNVFHNQYRLKNMTRTEAREAIIGPLGRLGISVTYDPALLETLLADLARPDLEMPLLQLICTSAAFLIGEKLREENETNKGAQRCPSL